MKHLILLRHGEAGFSDGLDFQRQLTSRGKENLNRLGQSIQSDSLKVDFMYCSSSTRTRETAEIIKKNTSTWELKSIHLRSMKAIWTPSSNYWKTRQRN